MIFSESTELLEALDESAVSLTIRHVFNRLTTADLSAHKLTNTRKALEQTVAGTNSVEDIAYLRKDLQIGIAGLRRVLEKHPDPTERAETAKHLEWLQVEYSRMLRDRLKEIRDGR